MMPAASKSFARAAMFAAAVFLAGCNGKSLEDIAPKAERQLPVKIVREMKAKGMTTTSPIMMRIFKEEGVLEVWKQKDTGRYDKIAEYQICAWSGKLGPKFTEGDRQAPEGFYSIGSGQMNPGSNYYLSFNIGFPNAYDRAHGHTGANLMVHGACSSSGCYSMTDEQVAQIYAFARDAFKGGQKAFQLEALPFRMTPANMARYRNDPNYEFWTMLKAGYDYFEITKVPPKVDVCDGHYVFNQVAEPGEAFDPKGACPPATQPELLQTAYQSYQHKFDAAFSGALSSGNVIDPLPSISGMKEAMLVADWSRRRSRGEKVSRKPPSLASMAAEGQAEQQAAANEAAARKAAMAKPAQVPVQQAGAAPAQEGSQPATDVSASTAKGANAAEMKVAADAAPTPSPNPREQGAAVEQNAPAAAPERKPRLGRLRNLFGG